MFDQTHEECGVYGIWQPEKCTVARTVLYGLIALQHRGEESAGIAVNEDRVIRCYKQLGLAGEVFTQGVLDSLGSGNMAVGHVRYSTSGGDTPENAQPMLVKHIKGQLALA
ncbi:MAG: amidophosphoribosyltransferase, partial [Lachnospiraceae bacterium]|nr:amidophosphoribosyltransferase [Lachnospiraceae bacterium]